ACDPAASPDRPGAARPCYGIRPKMLATLRDAVNRAYRPCCLPAQGRRINKTTFRILKKSIFAFGSVGHASLCPSRFRQPRDRLARIEANGLGPVEKLDGADRLPAGFDVADITRSALESRGDVDLAQPGSLALRRQEYPQRLMSRRCKAARHLSPPDRTAASPNRNFAYGKMADREMTPLILRKRRPH